MQHNNQYSGREMMGAPQMLNGMSNGMTSNGNGANNGAHSNNKGDMHANYIEIGGQQH